MTNYKKELDKYNLMLAKSVKMGRIAQIACILGLLINLSVLLLVFVQKVS